MAWTNSYRKRDAESGSEVRFSGTDSHLPWETISVVLSTGEPERLIESRDCLGG